MAAYSPPSLKIYQEFLPAVSGASLPLSACLIAPQFELHRYSEDTEKAYLAAYDAVSGNTSTTWPGRHALTSTIDLLSVKVYLEDAQLKYHNFNLTGTLIGGLRDGLLTAGGNKIRSNSFVFKTGKIGGGNIRDGRCDAPNGT
jgi:hypothetical protein